MNILKILLNLLKKNMSLYCKTDKIQVDQLKDNIKNSKIIENQKTDSIPTQSDILNTQYDFISKEKNFNNENNNEKSLCYNNNSYKRLIIIISSVVIFSLVIAILLILLFKSEKEIQLKDEIKSEEETKLEEEEKIFERINLEEITFEEVISIIGGQTEENQKIINESLNNIYEDINKIETNKSQVINKIDYKKNNLNITFFLNSINSK